VSRRAIVKMRRLFSKSVVPAVSAFGNGCSMWERETNLFGAPGPQKETPDTHAVYPMSINLSHPVRAAANIHGRLQKAAPEMREALVEELWCGRGSILPAPRPFWLSNWAPAI